MEIGKKYTFIYALKDNVDWLIHGIQELSLQQIREEISRDLIRKTSNSFDLSTYNPYQGEPARLLEHGDLLDIENREVKKHIIH